MSTKFTAWILSFLSFFAVWNWSGQPNNIPETRVYDGAAMAVDKYGVWPTKEFTQSDARLNWLGAGLLEAAFALKGMIRGGTKTETMLVLHKGKVIYERYAEGFDENSTKVMYSVTKSVVQALLCIAIKEGKIKGVDQKVIEFYPEAKIAPGQECKRDITIDHLLTMTSGLPGDKDDWDQAWGEWWTAKDTGLAAFMTPQVNAPGVKHSYSSGPSMQTLACLISRAVGKDLFSYAKEKLFKPLGMKSVTWERAADGRCFGGFGIQMSTRDMARFGYLYLNYGRWENKQILPVQWVAQSPPKSMSPRAYGRLFWNLDLAPFGSAYEANGAYGQYIEILPEWDTVIVRTGTQGPVDVFIRMIGEQLGIS